MWVQEYITINLFFWLPLLTGRRPPVVGPFDMFGLKSNLFFVLKIQTFRVQNESSTLIFQLSWISESSQPEHRKTDYFFHLSVISKQSETIQYQRITMVIEWSRTQIPDSWPNLRDLSICSYDNICAQHENSTQLIKNSL